jgi:hypothetical protein
MRRQKACEAVWTDGQPRRRITRNFKRIRAGPRAKGEGVLLSQGLRAVQLALVVGCAIMFLSGVAPLLSIASVERVRLPEPQVPAPRDTAFARYQVIGERKLFHRDDTPLPVAEAIVPELLPESKLPWKLVGTIAMSDPKQSVATLLHATEAGRTGAFRVGQELESGITLLGIERKRVRINNRGAEQQISMEDDESGGSPGLRLGAAAARGSAGPARGARPQRPLRPPATPAARERQRLQELREQAQNAGAEIPDPVDPEESPAEAQELLNQQERLERFMSSARMTPVHDENGTWVGLTLDEVKPEGPLAGMPAGTVCSEVNGVSLSQMHVAMQRIGADEAACVRCTLPDGSQRTACF